MTVIKIVLEIQCDHFYLNKSLISCFFYQKSYKILIFLDKPLNNCIFTILENIERRIKTWDLCESFHFFCNLLIKKKLKWKVFDQFKDVVLLSKILREASYKLLINPSLLVLLKKFDLVFISNLLSILSAHDHYCNISCHL